MVQLGLHVNVGLGGWWSRMHGNRSKGPAPCQSAGAATTCTATLVVHDSHCWCVGVNVHTKQSRAGVPPTDAKRSTISTHCGSRGTGVLGEASLATNGDLFAPMLESNMH